MGIGHRIPPAQTDKDKTQQDKAMRLYRIVV